MALNMGRNFLWSIGVDVTFYETNSWDVRDRFEYVEQKCPEMDPKVQSTLTQPDKTYITLFNPINLTR